MSVSIKGLSHAAVLAALYNGSKPQGLGFMHFDPKPMTEDEAEKLLGQDYFDYLNGRVMKIAIKPDSNEVDERGYDRDNGQGAVQRVINELRATANPNSDVIERQHQENTFVSAMFLSEHLADQSKLTVDGAVATFDMGLTDVAPYLKPRLDAVLGGGNDTDDE